LLARTHHRGDPVPAWALRLGVLVVFLAVWEGFARASHSFLIPTFTETVGAILQLAFVNRRIWEPLLISNQALVLGYGLSVLIGVPLGLAAGRIKRLERIMNPYAAILLALPVAPLIPIVIIALGLTLAARVAIVVLFTVIFIFVNARAGVRNVDPQLIEMAVSFGASERQIWRKVVLPGAMPALFAGLRIGLGRAIAGMVVVELILIASGVGRLLLEFTGRLESDYVFATVAIVIGEALLLLEMMRRLELRVAPWARSRIVD
jgi:NitT/TauT family transport system permease protein